MSITCSVLREPREYLYQGHCALISVSFLISKFWPSLFLILPGLFFHYGFISGRKKDPGLLVPGSFLMGFGFIFADGCFIGSQPP
jgi:uncharacterized BrkB/YihY/UPF0761 family membrane protein